METETSRCHIRDIEGMNLIRMRTTNRFQVASAANAIFGFGQFQVRFSRDQFLDDLHADLDTITER